MTMNTADDTKNTAEAAGCLDTQMRTALNRAIVAVREAAHDRAYLYQLARTAMIELAYDGDLEAVHELQKEAARLRWLLSEKNT